MSATLIHSQLRRVVSPAIAGLACAVVVALSGCERIGQRVDTSGKLAGEIEWARAALERNPQLEVVASDPQTRVFTVRNRTTGEIQAVKIDELAGAPVSQLEAAQPAQPAPAASTAQSQEQPAAVAARPAERPAAPEPAAPAREHTTRAPERAAAAAAPARSPTSAQGSYRIERTDGQLRVSGPGVSIVSSGDNAQSSPTGEAGVLAAEPIICEGRRMMHLDSRGMYVDGDAIVARGGCELFITNSRIAASGTAIVVEDAVVHVSNSHITGANASFDASDRARVFVRGSTFEGVPRRAELAVVQDQGGNRWR